jgi:hypothetical protein
VAIALLTGLAVLWAASPRGEPILVGSLLGWGIMAATGTATGIWMIRVYGKPGSGFLAAIAAGMLARLFLGAGGAWWAARQGKEMVWAYLVGLLAGYLPLQLFELAWFFRKARREARDTAC